MRVYSILLSKYTTCWRLTLINRSLNHSKPPGPYISSTWSNQSESTPITALFLTTGPPTQCYLNLIYLLKSICLNLNLSKSNQSVLFRSIHLNLNLLIFKQCESTPIIAPLLFLTTWPPIVPFKSNLFRERFKIKKLKKKN